MKEPIEVESQHEKDIEGKASSLKVKMKKKPKFSKKEKGVSLRTIEKSALRLMLDQEINKLQKFQNPKVIEAAKNVPKQTPIGQTKHLETRGPLAYDTVKNL